MCLIHFLYIVYGNSLLLCPLQNWYVEALMSYVMVLVGQPLRIVYIMGTLP